MKRHRKEKLLLKQLEIIPNISLACEKVGLSRNTVYRWCKEDSEFKTQLDIALESGLHSVSDLAESKLISHINTGNFRAIQYWLDNHKTEYMRPRSIDFWDRKESPPVVNVMITPVNTRNKNGTLNNELPEVSINKG